MNYEKPKNSKKGLIITLVLIPFLVVIAVVGAISINLIREGKPSLIATLTQEAETEKTYTIDTSGGLELPQGIETFMLLGSDYRPESGYRTDVMLLVVVKKQDSKINLLSFPRDLWVSIPGFGEQRINTVQPYGGYELLSDTLFVNFGFKPDHYAMVDFEGFKEIVNALGGIEVNVTAAMEDHCEFNAQRWCVIEPGVVPMDGDFALWYVRARYNSSDLDRTRRAQEVIQAMAKKSLSFEAISNSAKVVGAAQNAVESDLTIKDLMPLFLRFGKLTDEDAVTSYTMGSNEVTGWITDGGADVLLPNYPAIQEMLLKVFFIETP